LTHAVGMRCAKLTTMGATKTASGIAFVLLALGCGGRVENQVSASVGGSEVTHPFALKLTTLAERNWLGRSVSDASAESSKVSL